VSKFLSIEFPTLNAATDAGWFERAISFLGDSMIGCDTKQQFSRVACRCGRPIDPHRWQQGRRRRWRRRGGRGRRRRPCSRECPTDRLTTPDNAIYMQRWALVSSVPCHHDELLSRHSRVRVCGRILDVTRCRRCDQRRHWPVAGSMRRRRRT